MNDASHGYIVMHLIVFKFCLVKSVGQFCLVHHIIATLKSIGYSTCNCRLGHYAEFAAIFQVDELNKIH